MASVGVMLSGVAITVGGDGADPWIRRLGPTGVADVMHGIEEEEVLQVLVGLEHRWDIVVPGANSQRVSSRRSVGDGRARNQQVGPAELVNQLSRGLGDLGAYDVVAL